MSIYICMHNFFFFLCVFVCVFWWVCIFVRVFLCMFVCVCGCTLSLIFSLLYITPILHLIPSPFSQPKVFTTGKFGCLADLKFFTCFVAVDHFCFADGSREMYFYRINCSYDRRNRLIYDEIDIDMVIIYLSPIISG